MKVLATEGEPMFRKLPPTYNVDPGHDVVWAWRIRGPADRHAGIGIHGAEVVLGNLRAAGPEGCERPSHVHALVVHSEPVGLPARAGVRVPGQHSPVRVERREAVARVSARIGDGSEQPSDVERRSRGRERPHGAVCARRPRHQRPVDGTDRSQIATWRTVDVREAAAEVDRVADAQDGVDRAAHQIARFVRFFRDDCSSSRWCDAQDAQDHAEEGFGTRGQRENPIRR
jgi:hypothetical protein